MNNWRKEFVEDLHKKRTSYRDMIEFCCDSLVLNNEIIPKAYSLGWGVDVENGSDYDEETDEYEDVYQYYIVGCRDAERLTEYTNELVYYIDELDMYVLGVTHFGTMWEGVPSNWKSLDEMEA